jgi:hypothetical protein
MPGARYVGIRLDYGQAVHHVPQIRNYPVTRTGARFSAER